MQQKEVIYSLRTLINCDCQIYDPADQRINIVELRNSEEKSTELMLMQLWMETQMLIPHLGNVVQKDIALLAQSDELLGKPTEYSMLWLRHRRVCHHIIIEGIIFPQALKDLEWFALSFSNDRLNVPPTGEFKSMVGVMHVGQAFNDHPLVSNSKSVAGVDLWVEGCREGARQEPWQLFPNELVQ
jgi:hypothetical protein